MNTLRPDVRKTIVDMHTLERAVNQAWDMAIEGTMDGAGVSESKAEKMLGAECRHWSKLIERKDEYCYKVFQDEIPFIFDSPTLVKLELTLDEAVALYRIRKSQWVLSRHMNMVERKIETALSPDPEKKSNAYTQKFG